MATPLTIKIFLEDGEPDGLRTVELSNWIGKSIIIPRSKLKNVKDRENCNKPAVYFLVGKEDEEKLSVYIGEAEALWKRLSRHAKKAEKKEEDDWKTAIAFFSQDDTLTKAHVKYLESRCIEIAKRIEQIDRFELRNKKGSFLPNLSAPEKAVVEQFLNNLRLLLTAAGYPILQEVVSKDQESVDDPLLICRGKDAKAEGRLTNDGFVVYRGSTATANLAPSRKEEFQKRLDKLLGNGSLKQKNGAYVFIRDHVFDTPSGASCSVLGHSSNGWEEWKTEDGRTCREIYGSDPNSSEDEKIRKVPRDSRTSTTKSRKSRKKSAGSKVNASGPLFFCSGKGAEATGQKTDKGFVVYRGSTATTDLAESSKEEFQKRLDKLVAAGSLKLEGEIYVFIKNHDFKTPSGASCAVLGRHSNGKEAWKTKDGKTYKEIYGQDSDDF